MRLRVIAGKLGGLIFDSPPGHRTHPMGEKVRGAIFNMLGDIKRLSVLDAFSGSGALAFEALSRGAGQVTAVEIDKTAYDTIAKNINTLGLESSVKLVRANVSSWANRNKDRQFDVVFIDPPYDTVNYAILQKLAKAAKPGGVVVYSMPNDHEFRLPESQFEKLSEKKYAGAALVFYRRMS